MTAPMQTLLSRLQKVRFTAKTRRRGSHKGGRTSNKFGSSLEFSDFRLYQPGDDVRQIDWNIYGRTQKHYIKRFLDEQELAITVYLDASNSMQALDSKWNRAKELAAAFSYIALQGEDRLAFIPVSSAHYTKVNRKGAKYGRAIFLDILKLPKKQGGGSFTENLHKNTLKNNQLAVLITDGLEPLASFESLFHLIASAKQEVRVIQCLSKEEIKPTFSGDIKLIDSESLESVNVTMTESILVKYQKQLKEHNDGLAALCRRYGFSYLAISDDEDLQPFIFHECIAKRVLY